MATAKNKLPKELQTFKREMKKATFEEKVESYFSLSHVIDEYSGQKKDIIISLFNPAEKYTFYNEYYPLRKAIEANEDKVRTVNKERYRLYSLLYRFPTEDRGYIYLCGRVCGLCTTVLKGGNGKG